VEPGEVSAGVLPAARAPLELAQAVAKRTNALSMAARVR
jgi:hypothetical protein